MSSPIKTNRWHGLRARVLAEESVCWLCGHPIDFDAAPCTRYAPSVDHVVPRSRGGDPFDRANCRAAHFGCNSSKRDAMRVRRPRTSRLL